MGNCIYNMLVYIAMTHKCVVGVQSDKMYIPGSLCLKPGEILRNPGYPLVYSMSRAGGRYSGILAT